MLVCGSPFSIVGSLMVHSKWLYTRSEFWIPEQAILCNINEENKNQYMSQLSSL